MANRDGNTATSTEVIPAGHAELTAEEELAEDWSELPAQVTTFGPMIPKGAKNVALAKEFIKYAIRPKVLNEYLKAGLRNSSKPCRSGSFTASGLLQPRRWP